MSAPHPQAVAADPDISAFVTANAGSGKTTTLVNRVARLLLKRVDPETILCMTFTKAAAAEMQRRLFEQLGGWALMDDAELSCKLGELEGRAAKDYEPERLSLARTLFARALETPGGLKIQTIHAFCEKLLRRFPLEAGVSPGFQVMEDASAAQVAAEARDGVAARALAGEPVLAEAYARFAVALDFASFEAMFAAFETRREALAAYVAACGGLRGLPAAVARACGLEGLADAGAIELAAVTPPALSVELWRAGAQVLAEGGTRDQKCAEQMAAVAEDAGRGQAAFGAALRVFCTAAGEPARWLDTTASLKARPDLRQRLVDERERLLEVSRQAKAARVAEDTVQALVLAAFYADAYARAKARRGALDFADLIARTLDLLTGQDAAAWVLYKLDAGLEHILVDEAQDTAPEQWEILRALTDQFFVGADGRDRPLERSVFVVGDEKQSIFSFQGAAPERLMRERDYYAVLADSVSRRFETVPLVESWRSAKEVLDFVDRVFAPQDLRQALQPRRNGEAVGLVIEHVSKRRETDPEGRGTIDLWPLEREEENPERRAWDEPLDAGGRGGAWRRLAERIAGEIKALVERGEAVHDKGASDPKAWRPAGYGDVLILVRKRKVLFEELLRALKRAGVPVAGADRLVLSEHPAFEDFLALARFALFPDDDLTLAALLRSPFCDVDEGGLFDLAHGRKGSLWSTLARRADKRSEWRAASSFLGWARDEARTRTPFDFYGRVLSRLDGAGRSMRTRLVTRLGPEASDAIEEFLAQVLSAEQRGICDLERFADGLSRLTVSVKREMDEPRGEVRVMTAHGSKGLEAPIVFLPETIGAGAARGSPLLETEDGGFLWCASSANDCEASAAAREARKARDDEEAHRLLYVALTRARDRLVIAGRINARAKVETLKGWWAPMSAAFDHPDVADQVRSVRCGEMEIRRFGADPQVLGRGGAAPAPRPSPLPAWALCPARPEAPEAIYASPSTLLEDVRSPSLSPLVRRGGMGRFRRGTLIHRLLQLLPDLEPEARAAGAARLLAKEPDLNPDQRREMTAAALAVLSDPAFAEVFGPGSRAEAAIAGTAPDLPGGLSISGRVDRMMITPDRVLVVDFKTNRPAPADIEAADPAYVLQMAVYAAVLRAVFPGRRVETALVWTDGPRLMPVPEGVMADALQFLTKGPSNFS
ncbi:MAG TPA: double-strand break repair helicase AddA [Caulobacteraceae bacterium]|jgi:ATP-dependent helicase/nuclease subunit A|nr:double-strand break repair helicase AddA [Caulobacteraceae bacterium]